MVLSVWASEIHVYKNSCLVGRWLMAQDLVEEIWCHVENLLGVTGGLQHHTNTTKTYNLYANIACLSIGFHSRPILSFKLFLP